jgi:hypothetical protein
MSGEDRSEVIADEKKRLASVVNDYEKNKVQIEFHNAMLKALLPSVYKDETASFSEDAIMQCLTCCRHFKLNETPRFENDSYGNYWCSLECKCPLIIFEETPAYIPQKVFEDTIAALSIVRPDTNEKV